MKFLFILGIILAMCGVILIFDARPITKKTRNRKIESAERFPEVRKLLRLVQHKNKKPVSIWTLTGFYFFKWF